MTDYNTFGPHVVFFPTLTMLLVDQRDDGQTWMPYQKEDNKILNWYEKMAHDMYMQNIAEGMTHEEIMIMAAK